MALVAARTVACQYTGRPPELAAASCGRTLQDPTMFSDIALEALCGIIWLQTPLSFGLFSIVMAGMAFFNGFLTISTGIYRVPYPKMPYLYIFDINLRRIGWYQVILSAITILTAISLAFYRGPL